MSKISDIERARVLAAECTVIANIPDDLMTRMNEANAKFKADGGCSGCESDRIGVHYFDCTANRNDLY